VVPLGDGLACVTEQSRQVLDVLTSMFLHGSWLHLLGNMWFLYLFSRQRCSRSCSTPRRPFRWSVRRARSAA
jgi:hypothetical protein